MGRFSRAFFRSLDNDQSNLIVDLLLDDRRRVLPRVAFFGHWGKLGSNDSWPFVMKNGEIDFGDQVDEDDSSSKPLDRKERYGEIGFGERIVAVGEVYVLTYNGDIWPLRLEKLSDFSEL